MKRINPPNIVIALCLLFLAFGLQAQSTNQTLTSTPLHSIVVNHDNLFPEGLSFNPLTQRFVLGSFRHGAIYEVDSQGNSVKIIEDERLHSVFAVRIDVKRNRILALTSDLGVSAQSNTAQVKRYAGLGIYDLTSGESLKFIDLAALIPNAEHLVNGMTLDNDGNAYITDSFAAAIYKVDVNGVASVFLHSDEFIGEGINLNGIVYHPDGYLLVVKKSSGVLYNVPITLPNTFRAVVADQKYLAADGLILTNKNELVIIANRIVGHASDTAFWVSTNDNWQSMVTGKQFNFGDVYPTTGIVQGGKIYAVVSKLNTLVAAPKSEKSTLRQKAKILQIGQVNSAFSE